jgi:hypothetical protein
MKNKSKTSLLKKDSNLPITSGSFKGFALHLSDKDDAKITAYGDDVQLSPISPDFTLERAYLGICV